MNLTSKLILIVLIILVLGFSLKLVSSKTLCGGKHNIQVKVVDLPELVLNTNIQTKVFVLPEISGFKDLYQDFSVTSAKAIITCNTPGNCIIYVNNQVCLTIPTSTQNLFSLDCNNLFNDGINTVGFSNNGNMNWLFLETKISSVFC